MNEHRIYVRCTTDYYMRSIYNKFGNVCNQTWRTKGGNYNFWAGLIATGINVALLKWGGFF